MFNQHDLFYSNIPCTERSDKLWMETHNMLTVYGYNKQSGGKSAWNITSSSLFDNCKQEHDTSSFYIKSVFEKNNQ